MTPLIEAAISLDRAVGAYFSRELEPAMVLASITRLNREIGIRYGQVPDPRLKDLQRRVNQVTKATKSGDHRLLRESMEALRRDLFSIEPETGGF